MKILFIKRNIDKLLKFLLIFQHNFLINFFTKIYIPQKIHASKNYYVDAFKNLKISLSKNDISHKLKYQIPDQFILDLAFKTVVVHKKSKITINHGKILYSELSEYINKNKIDNINIIETGTARGFSAICLAKALEDQKQNGKVYTFDILPHKKEIYWNTIDDLEKKNSRENILFHWRHLSDTFIIFINNFAHLFLKYIHFKRIHFAFLDGSHYGHDIIYEFGHIAKLQEKGDITIFDDFNDVNYSDLHNEIINLINKYKYTTKIIDVNESHRKILIAKKL